MSGAAEGRLFGKDTLNRYLSDNRTISIPGESGHAKILADWLNAISSSTSKETSLEPKFIQDIICGLLGYTIYPPAPGAVATVWAKPPSSATRIAQEPDLEFGHFAFGVDSSFVAVGELKSPGTPFDTPQARKDPKTPVEQAFEYGQSILGVRWVLVTDMRVLRLYSVDSIGAFEKFDLADCIDSQGKVTEKFRRLYFLVHRDFLIGVGERAPVSSLYAKRSVRQLEIRDGFYEVYYQIRTDLYQAIADVARERDIVVLSDEIYERFIYEGQALSITSLPGMLERTIMLSGFSKTYAMTGWRLGYAVMPKGLVEPIVRMIVNSVSCTAPFIQRAGIEALTGPQDFIPGMIDEFKKRRDLIVDGLNEIPGVSCRKPKGAFYAFPNIKKTGMKSKALAEYLLKGANVAMLAGSDFGKYGEGYLRLSYANSRQNLQKAIDRISAALKKAK